MTEPEFIIVEPVHVPDVGAGLCVQVALLGVGRPAGDATQRLVGVITVCPGSSDPPEKIFNIFASENEVYTIY